MGKKREALEWIESSIAKYPNRGYLWYLKGLLLEESQTNEKLECHDKALGLFEESDALERHLVHYAKAGVLYGANRLEEALLSLEKATESQPSCPAGWSRKGFALLRLNRIPESLGSFEKALEMNPKYWEPWYGKGAVLAVLGSDHYDEAIEYFDKAIEIEPGKAVLYFSKGELLSRMDRLTEALTFYEQGLKYDTKDSCGWCLKGLAFAKLKRYSEALDSFNKSLDLGPPDYCTLVLVHKGMALTLLERIPEAKDSIKNVDEKKIDEADSLNNYAWLLYRLREFNKGIEISRKAIEVKPDDAHIWDTLACNLQGAGLDSEALEAFEKAVRLKKTDEAINWEALAKLYERLGRHEEADRAKQKIRKKDSKA